MVLLSGLSRAALARAPTPAGILEPRAGGQLVISSVGLFNPPNFLKLLRVVYDDTVDARFYRIELAGPTPVVVVRGDGVAGDAVVTTLQLPSGTAPGSYSMRCLALDAGGSPIGDWSDPVPVAVVAMAPAPFTPGSSQSISGVYLASFVNVPEGVTLSVEGELTLLSLGLVQINGAVVGMPGAGPGGTGASVRLLSLRPVGITGSVRGGDGAPGTSASTQGAPALGGNGGGGGDVVVLTHNAGLTLVSGAVIASGGGGAGGSATAAGQDASVPGDPGGDATAVAGNGADGGDLVVHAVGSALTWPAASGILSCGNGGLGGATDGRGGRGGSESVDLDAGFGGGVDAQGGAGGSSGSLFVSANDLDADGDLVLTLEELQLVVGGVGGEAGTVTGIGGALGAPLAGKQGVPASLKRSASQPATVTSDGNKGGDGWCNPDPGKPALAIGADGQRGGPGGDAEARGGDGGNVKSLGVTIPGADISFDFSAGVSGASGGRADAAGGDGGAEGGDGGDATASGGDGGNTTDIMGLRGGRGGDACAYGGSGRRAPDRCNPPQPNNQDGGNGGGATARGGNGGNGSTHGGDGGDARALGGNAGDGGDGDGPSAPSAPGPGNATGGNGGNGLFENGSDGGSDGVPGADGVPGKPCEKKCGQGVKPLNPAQPPGGMDYCWVAPGQPSEPCALFCPAGDLDVVAPVLFDDVAGLPIVDLPQESYGIEVEGAFFPAAEPTDGTGRGAIPYAATNVNYSYDCRDGWVVACGTYVYGPFRVMSVDLNADGIVDHTDIAILELHLNTSDACYDLDGSGWVDLSDLAIQQQHIGHMQPIGPPIIAALDVDLFQDSFPAIAEIDYANLANNSVRLDMARNISSPADQSNDPGDSICVTITTVPPIVAMHERPEMHVRLQTNPLFDACRTLPAGFTQNGRAIDGVVLGDTTYEMPSHEVVPNRWNWDLPDTGSFFPGDVIHYFLRAEAGMGGEGGVALLPPDTTGFSLFPGMPGYQSLRFPSAFKVRALPTMRSVTQNDQPRILFWNDQDSRGGENEWIGALDNLGYREGTEYDLYYTHGPASGVGNGLGGRTNELKMSGYSTLLYTAANLGNFTFSNGDFENDAGNDIAVVDAWLSLGGKNLFATGDNIIQDLSVSGVQAVAFRDRWFSVNYDGADLGPLIGGQTTPTVSPITVPGAPALSRSYIAFGGYSGSNDFDAITASGAAVRIAQFTSPTGGLGVYPYAAAVYNNVVESMVRVVFMPYDLQFIYNLPSLDKAFGLPTRANILRDVLTFFGEMPGGPAVDVTPDAGVFTAKNFPNPFNPRTTISYSLPQTGRVRLTIFDLSGSLVRVLVDEVRAVGSYQVQWNGTNDRGQQMASGVYVCRMEAGAFRETRRMTLVK
jgi:hypothetical protein